MLEEEREGEQPTNFPFTPEGMEMRAEVMRFKSKMQQLGFKENWIKIYFR